MYVLYLESDLKKKIELGEKMGSECPGKAAQNRLGAQKLA